MPLAVDASASPLLPPLPPSQNLQLRPAPGASPAPPPPSAARRLMTPHYPFLSGSSFSPAADARVLPSRPAPAAASEPQPATWIPLESQRTAASRKQQIDERVEIKTEVIDTAEEGHDKESTANEVPKRVEKSAKRTRNVKISKQKLSVPVTEMSGLKTEGAPETANRFDSSLGLLTKKFVELLKNADYGILDLNKAAEILEVQKRRIYDITNVLEGVDLIEKKLKNCIRWKGSDMSRPQELEDQITMLKDEVDTLHKEESRLDEMIIKMEDSLQAFAADQNSRKWLHLTKEDITNIPRFKDSTLIAINAPHGTSVEVRDPDEVNEFSERQYEILLRSSMGPIDCYLISNDEAMYDTSNSIHQPPPRDLNGNGESPHPISHDVGTGAMQDECITCNGVFRSSTSKDFLSGILQIVPSDIEIGSDYWFSSDHDISLSDTWGT